MNKLFQLIGFVILVIVLWWALTTILALFAVPTVFSTLAVVAFIVIAAFAFYDFLNSGSWFWTRR